MKDTFAPLPPIQPGQRSCLFYYIHLGPGFLIWIEFPGHPCPPAQKDERRRSVRPETPYVAERARNLFQSRSIHDLAGESIHGAEQPYFPIVTNLYNDNVREANFSRVIFQRYSAIQRMVEAANSQLRWFLTGAVTGPIASHIQNISLRKMCDPVHLCLVIVPESTS